MGNVLLDTNFILSCVAQKIEFFEQIQSMGHKIIIPEEVIKEIVSISTSNKALRFRTAAKLSLMILENETFIKIRLGTRDVDKGIKKLAEEDNKLIIATLDRAIKKSNKNKNLVIRNKKKLEII